MPLLDGIIGCWNPSVRGSGYLLPDLSGRGNHLTLVNMDASTDWVASVVRGNSGRVLDLDGVNDHAILNKDWTTLQRFTCCAWFYFRGGGIQGIFGAANSSLTRSNFYIRPGINSGFTTYGGSFVETPFPALTTNAWSFVATSYDGESLRHWLNGINAATGSYAGVIDTDSSMRFAIGRPGNYGGQYGNGIIGEVTLYERALTAAEVMELYRSGNGAIGRQLTGQTRRQVYGFVPAAAFKAHWAQRSALIGSGVY